MQRLEMDNYKNNYSTPNPEKKYKDVHRNLFDAHNDRIRGIDYKYPQVNPHDEYNNKPNKRKFGSIMDQKMLQNS